MDIPKQNNISILMHSTPYFLTLKVQFSSSTPPGTTAFDNKKNWISRYNNAGRCTK